MLSSRRNLPTTLLSSARASDLKKATVNLKPGFCSSKMKGFVQYLDHLALQSTNFQSYFCYKPYTFHFKS